MMKYKPNNSQHFLVKKILYAKLEYLAVYGRTCMGESWLLDYYQFVFRILAAFLPNHAKFCGDRLKNARDIRNQKFVLPKMWAKVHQNRLRPATP